MAEVSDEFSTVLLAAWYSTEPISQALARRGKSRWSYSGQYAAVAALIAMLLLGIANVSVLPPLSSNTGPFAPKISESRLAVAGPQVTTTDSPTSPLDKLAL